MFENNQSNRELVLADRKQIISLMKSQIESYEEVLEGRLTMAQSSIDIIRAMSASAVLGER